MAKGILEYDLNEPDDIIAHKRAIKATDMALAIFQFAYNTKYESKEDLLDAIYEEFWDILKEHSVNIDEIIN